MSLYAFTQTSADALSSQIARQIAHEIGKRYLPGHALPAAAALSLNFGVNRHCLGAAIEELVAAGKLERREGGAVFVCEARIDDHAALDTRTVEDLAITGSGAESRIVRRQSVQASDHLAQQLGLRAGDAVLSFDTLRIVGGDPVCLSSHFVSSARYPELEAGYRGGSLHQFLNEAYGCRLRCADSAVSAMLPDSTDARLLGMPVNVPVLKVKRLHADLRDGAPVEYVVSRFRADRVQVRVHADA